MIGADERNLEDYPGIEQPAGATTETKSLLSLAGDLEARRLLREARSCLDEVIADLRGLEAAVARYKAWVAVPAEFLRAERNRVA